MPGDAAPREARTGHARRIVLINDTSDAPNWGAKATSEALRDLLGAAGGEVVSTLYSSSLLGPSWRSRALTRRAVTRTKLILRSGLRRFAEKVGNRVSVTLPDPLARRAERLEPLAQRVMRGETFADELAALRQGDAVVINGEGCIYGRRRESFMMFFLAYLAKVHLGKTTVLVNHSAELGDPSLREVAAHVLPLLDDVIFREPHSARRAPIQRGHGGADALYAFPPCPSWDAARLLPLDARFASFDPEAPYVCVGGSSALFRSDEGWRAARADPHAEFLTLCQTLKATFAQVVLTASSAPDMRLFEPLAARLGLPLLPTGTPTRLAQDVLGGASAYVGGRWHGGVFALSGGAPVVALSAYTPKMEALLEQAELPGPVFDVFSVGRDAKGIVALTERHVAAGDALRERLRARAQTLRQHAWDNVRFLQPTPLVNPTLDEAEVIL